MGTALLNGVLVSTDGRNTRVKKYLACVKRTESAERLRSMFSSRDGIVEIICDDGVRAAQEADVVILGFQPGDVGSVLGNHDISQALQGKLIISMLAGVGRDRIRHELSRGGQSKDTEHDWHIVRLIPSIGAQIGASVSLVSDSGVDKVKRDFVQWLVTQVGTLERVPEELMETAVAVSSTCHALITTAVEAVTEGSISRGMNRATARAIAAKCLRSASALLLESMTLEELRDSMSVPCGITTEAWIKLDEGNIRSAVTQTVRHAVDYSHGMA